MYVVTLRFKQTRLTAEVAPPLWSMRSADLQLERLSLRLHHLQPAVQLRDLWRLLLSAITCATVSTADRQPTQQAAALMDNIFAIFWIQNYSKCDLILQITFSVIYHFSKLNFEKLEQFFENLIS